VAATAVVAAVVAAIDPRARNSTTWGDEGSSPHFSLAAH
jgi:hypothetical protein